MHTRRVDILTADPHMGAWLRDAVSKSDATVSTFPPNEAEQRMLRGETDLVILDADGDPAPFVEIVTRAAAKGSETRVLLLVETEALPRFVPPARGAVDFMVRGASAEEFGVRVRNLLWPGEESASDDLIHVEGLTLNLATYQAHVEGKPLDFAYLEYALFAFLVTHPGRTYSREALLSRVWGTDYYGGSRTVDVHGRRVRAKLGPELARRLVTVRNVGYLWNG
jgi:DNA-binding response OmpR family regulator